MRVAVEVLRAEPDHLQQPHGGGAARHVGADAVDDERLGQDVADRHARVERRVGVLEDVLDLPPDRLHLPQVELQEVGRVAAVVEDDLALVHRHGAHDRLADRGLARPGFADQAEAFAALDR